MPGIDSSLADAGRKRYEWARRMMSIVEKVAKGNKPLEGLRAGFCLHVTKETSVLVMAAKNLGAEVALCSANPLSAQEDIAAFLQGEGVSVYAWRNETQAEYRKCIRDVLAFRPDIITDDGGDLHYAAHAAKAGGIIGGTEETTSGVKRLAALERSKKLRYPVIAVNNARTKYLFDNRYGTGQSTLDGVLRATGMLLADSNVVVCGYGWVGKGVAATVRGMGAAVMVTEVDPVKALEAKMDGFSVVPLAQAARQGDLFITCTGQTGVIRKEHFAAMKDGAALANTGHFDVEIDATYLYRNFRPAQVRQDVERFDIGGKKLYFLSKGRVVNLVAAECHPPESTTVTIVECSSNPDQERNFVPKLVRGTLGIDNRIVWTNEDATFHSVTTDTGYVDPISGKFDSLDTIGLVSPGGTYEFVFTKAGEYPYHCEPHPWMTGKVVVLENFA